MTKEYEVKKIGNIEYYVAKFKSQDGIIKYGVHAREIETKKPLHSAIYAGLFDTPDEAEKAWVELVNSHQGRLP